jgi:hypothetical protein
LTIFSGCGTTRTKITFIEPERLPLGLTVPVAGYEWDGDPTYQGLVTHIKRLQQCVEKYKLLLKQIREWEDNQSAEIEKKKAELGIE